LELFDLVTKVIKWNKVYPQLLMQAPVDLIEKSDDSPSMIIPVLRLGIRFFRNPELSFLSPKLPSAHGSDVKPYFSAQTLVTVRSTPILITLLPYYIYNRWREIK
jgi:hypothetical protein